MKRLFLVLFCIIASIGLHAEEKETVEEDPFQSSLADTHGLISTLVAGSVSAITGHMVEAETDFVVAGPQPLTLSRIYSPGYNPDNLKDGAVSEGREGARCYRLHQKWEFNRPDRLHNWEQDEFQLQRSHGARLKYEQASENPETRVSAWVLNETKGLTNCGLHEISARTNLNNITLYLDKKHKTAAAIDGSGSTSYFLCKKHVSRERKGKQTRYSSRCLFEKKPNGNFIFFDPASFYATNPSESVEFARIRIHYQPKGKDIKIEASDGKEAIYKFKNYVIKLDVDEEEWPEPTNTTKNRYVLSEVNYTHKPTVKYEYEAPFEPNNKGLYLTRISRPDDRFEAFKFGGSGRISNRLAPVGPDAIPVTTHKFLYHRKETQFPDGTHDKMGELKGYTEVYDAYGRKTIFVYNKEYRPLSIQRYSGNTSYQLYSSEEYVWDDIYIHAQQPKPKTQARHPVPDFEIPLAEIGEGLITSPTKRRVSPTIEDYLKKRILRHGALVNRIAADGNLIGKYLKGADGTLYSARFFTYDGKGNILTDTLYGNLTGLNTQPLVLDAGRRIEQNGVEQYSNQFTYSQDHLNLLLREVHGNGKEIQYTYVPGTDLVASKCLLDRDKVVSREFREYDSNTTLVKTIKESGNLERRITYFHPRQSAPFGLPEVIEEKYEAEGQEHLLKRTVCHYSREGHLTKQEHFDSQSAYCYSLEWEYDAHGNVILEKDALGQLVRRKYDSNDNLIYEEGPGDSDETTYEYDYANRLVKTTKVGKDGLRSSTSYCYDYLGNRVAAVDRYGQETRYIYDDFGRLVETVYPEVADENGQLVHPTAQIQYDIAGNPIAMTDERGYTTAKSYNSRGKPVQISYPDGTAETFEYQLDGALAKSVSRNGAITIYQRDSLGRVLVEDVYSPQGELLTHQTYVYDGLHLVSATDAQGRVTQHRYDRAGRLIETVCEDHKTVFEYDTLGRLKKKKQTVAAGKPEERCDVYEYDQLNRVIEERIESAQGEVLTKVAYEYDERGNRIKAIRETEAGLSITKAFYNSDQQPILLMNAEGDETRITYDHFHRNAYGQIVLSVATDDAQGKSQIQIYDTHGRVIRRQRKNAFGVLTFDQEISYDRAGNQVRVIDKIIVDGQEQRQLVTAWTYNALGQETCLIEGVGLPEQRCTHTFYNGYGQKERTVQPNGIALFYTYDALGRLRTLSSSDQTISYVYKYNKSHQVVRVDDCIQGQATLLNYDRSGRLKREILGNGLSLRYQYDSLDRPTFLYLPDGSRINYAYDANFLRQVVWMKSGQELYSHIFQRYDLAGRLTESKLIGKGGTALSQHDRCSRPTGIQTAAWAQTIPQGGYDSIGRLIAFTVQDRAGETAYQFGYNDLDQLVTERGHVEHQYKADSVSNRLAKNDQAYSINALHQLTAQGNCQYQYDFNGNLVEKKRGEEITRYRYDALNRLVAVETQGSCTTYTYDCFNRRLSKKQGGREWKYFYQGQNEVGCFLGGKREELRVLALGIEAEIGAAVAMELQGKIYAPVHDHNGNIACLLDLDGKAIETYRYSAFGEEHIFDCMGQPVQSSQVKNPWRYASKRFDEETGFIYFGRRYYDPEIGRWITTDPSGFADGPNLYAYLHHRPLIYHDAYGLQTEEYLKGENADSSDLIYMDGGEDCIANESSSPHESMNDPFTYFNSEVYSELTLTEKIKRTGESIVRNFFNKIQATNRGQQAAMPGYGSFKQIQASECRAMLPPPTQAKISQYIKELYGISKIRNIYNKYIRGESTLKREVREVGTRSTSLEKLPFDINDLSQAGQVMDRGGLTRAGRALDKHGTRPNSVFPKATGNSQSKNIQGQSHLDEILNHKEAYWEINGNRYEVYIPDGRGASFWRDGSFKGFVERGIQI